MNIINLTTEHYKYRLNPESILKMDRALMLSERPYWSQHCLFPRITKGNSTFLPNDYFSAYQYANQVPVFLVTSNMVGDFFDIDFLGHHLKFTVPNDSLPTEDFNDDIKTILKKIKEGERVTIDIPSEDKDKKKDKEKEKEKKKDKEEDVGFEPVPIIDLWGVYISSGLKIHKLRNAHPQIFIWVDKIHDYVQREHSGDRHYYDLLTCQVILHEMMHALMDINILAPYHCDTNNIPKWFNVLREESLAEAGSLTMMERVWSKKDINYLKKHVAHPKRPFQYRLGSSYFKAGNGVVWCAIENWVERKYNQKVAEDWFRYIKRTYPRTDSKQLKLYEEGFRFSDTVFKYKSGPSKEMVLFLWLELVKKVIRDYAAMHQTSKSELMTAFPDNLNEHYEVFIDPLIQDHFVSKSYLSDDTPDENFSVDCKDGKLIICSYWHTNSMHPFVEHARELGFNIIDFWTK